MTRSAFRALAVLAGLAATAALLAWPGGRWEVTGGAARVGGSGSAVETRDRAYGLVSYLTVGEDCGLDQPHRWSFELDPRRTAGTGVLVGAVWAAVACAAGRGGPGPGDRRPAGAERAGRVGCRNSASGASRRGAVPTASRGHGAGLTAQTSATLQRVPTRPGVERLTMSRSDRRTPGPRLPVRRRSPEVVAWAGGGRSPVPGVDHV